MEAVSTKLKALIEQYAPQLNALSEEDICFKPSPIKWSKKEIVGHLIDSAQNNIRRFIVAQYEDNPSVIYDQDKWVIINDYQHQPREHVIQLWLLLNRQIAAVLSNTSIEGAQRTCNNQEWQTIEWLALDYIKHLQHHLHLVLNLEPAPYP